MLGGVHILKQEQRYFFFMVMQAIFHIALIVSIFFINLSLSVLIIDYRGYGKSNGEPSELGTYLDAETAWNNLNSHKDIKADNIIIFGRSLGGDVATSFAEKHPPAGLIIESSFT